MEILNNSYVLPRCDESMDDTQTHDYLIYSVLNCSILPRFIGLAIVILNIAALYVSFIKKMFWTTYVNCILAVLLPPLCISVLLFPIKNCLLAQPHISIISIEIMQILIQTAYDGIVFTLILLNIDLIIAFPDPELHNVERYKDTMQMLLLILWFGDAIVNFTFICGIKEDLLIKSFTSNIFPSTTYNGGISLVIGIMNLSFTFVLVFMFLCGKQTYYTSIRNRYTNFHFPLFKMNLIVITFRLIPEIIVYCKYHFAQTDQDYLFWNHLAFAEWIGLMILPLALLLDPQIYKYIFRNIRRSEYEQV